MPRCLDIFRLPESHGCLEHPCTLGFTQLSFRNLGNFPFAPFRPQHPQLSRFPLSRFSLSFGTGNFRKKSRESYVNPNPPPRSAHLFVGRETFAKLSRKLRVLRGRKGERKVTRFLNESYVNPNRLRAARNTLSALDVGLEVRRREVLEVVVAHGHAPPALLLLARRRRGR